MKKVINCINNNGGAVLMLFVILYFLGIITSVLGIDIAGLIVVAMVVMSAIGTGMVIGWMKLSKWAAE